MSGFRKDYTERFCLTPQTQKPAFRNNHTQIWVGEMLRNNPERMQPSHWVLEKNKKITWC